MIRYDSISSHILSFDMTTDLDIPRCFEMIMRTECLIMGDVNYYEFSKVPFYINDEGFHLHSVEKSLLTFEDELWILPSYGIDEDSYQKAQSEICSDSKIEENRKVLKEQRKREENRRTKKNRQ